MSLEEFSRDIVPIAQLFVTLIGLTSLVFIWWQIRSFSLWSKLQAQISLTNISAINAADRKIDKALSAIGVETRRETNPLSPEELERIIDDDDAYYAVKEVLSELENLATAISSGITHEDYAYDLHSSRLLRAYRLLHPAIDKLRDMQADDNIFLEMEKVALKWEARQQSEAAKLHADLNKLEEKRGELMTRRGANSVTD